MKTKPHLLCVDDDNKIRELLKIYLTNNNFRVSISKDAIEAEKLANFSTTLWSLGKNRNLKCRTS